MDSSSLFSLDILDMFREVCTPEDLTKAESAYSMLSSMTIGKGFYLQYSSTLRLSCAMGISCRLLQVLGKPMSSGLGAARVLLFWSIILSFSRFPSRDTCLASETGCEVGLLTSEMVELEPNLADEPFLIILESLFSSQMKPLPWLISPWLPTLQYSEEPAMSLEIIELRCDI